MEVNLSEVLKSNGKKGVYNMESNKLFLDNEKNEGQEKQSWISRIAKGKKATKKTGYGHCNAYSSVVCLKCDKCWGYNNKSYQQSNE